SVKSVSAKLAYLLAATSIGLPVLLVFHGVFAAREIHEMRSVFLRDRAATIAARLETLPAAELREDQLDELFETDPALLAVHVFRSGQPESSDPVPDSIRAGRELYRTEEIRSEVKDVFRAYIPFHSAGQI